MKMCFLSLLLEQVMYSLITDNANQFYRTSEPERLLAELWNEAFDRELTVYGPGQWEHLYPQLVGE
jgi:hypothetical protein